MSGVAALGERALVEGFVLAGARVIPAETPEAVRAAWNGLPTDIAVLLVTAQAQGALADLLPSRPELVWTVIPH